MGRGRIYEYTPGFIHAKSYLVDDRIGIVGTINMDYRSLYLHMECAAMLVECSALQKMKLDCVVTIEKSRRVTLQDCKRAGTVCSGRQSCGRSARFCDLGCVDTKPDTCLLG